MHLRIRRRRFGQLAIASAASAAIANLAGKAVAQSPSVIYAVRLPASSANPQVSNVANAANSTPTVTLETSDVTASQNIISSVSVSSTTVSNVSTSVETVAKATATRSQERVTGLTTLSNGTLVNTTVLNSPSGDVTRLIFIDPTSSKVENSLKVSGLPNNNSTVEDLAAINNDTLLSVISLNSGVPPFTLGTIDRTTGIVTVSDLSLDSNRRYSNLAQAPNGTIYATTLGREGATTLVTVDLANRSINTVVRLSYNNKPLSNDLLSLTVSPSGQLYALANPTYAATNSLFSVNQTTGVLTLVKPFNADQITFPRA